MVKKSKEQDELPRWLRVKVTRDDIGKAIMGKSTGCAISDAIARQYPDTSRQLSDIRSVKVTFPALGERAEYKMTLGGAKFIVRFDRGDRDLDGFELRLPLIAHTPVRGAPRKVQQRRAADHARRQRKIDAGQPLTPTEKTAHKHYRGEERPTTPGPVSIEDGPEDAVQVGGTLSPVSPGASGPTVLDENQWAESGPSTSRGKRPRHYRGYGMHALGQMDPTMLETAGETYDTA